MREKEREREHELELENFVYKDSNLDSDKNLTTVPC